MHMPDLRFLSRGVDAGVIPAPEAIEALMGLKADHQQAAQERRAAQAEAEAKAATTGLDVLTTAAVGGASGGDSLEEVLRTLAATSQMRGTTPALETLLNSGGVETLYPTVSPFSPEYTSQFSPLASDTGLDAEDTEALQKHATQMAQNGASPAEIRSALSNLVRENYGPHTEANVQPLIDGLATGG